MIDASDEPIKAESRSEKKKILKKSLPSLREKVRSLVSEDTKIILISSTVYDVCFEKLRSEGFNVVNEGSIPFPVKHQPEFRKKLSTLLQKYGR